MKRILIVSKAFYPEISPRSFRATELAKEFARQGHDVTVLLNYNGKDYSEFGIKNNIKILYYGPSKLKPVKIPFLKYWSNKINRLLYMMIHYPDIELTWLIKNRLKLEKDYDLMISIAVPYPVHWGAAWARNRKNRIASVWVADCGDPFTGNRLESFRWPFYFKYIEKWAFRKADYISIPVKDAIKGYYTEFRHKIKVIPQGFKFDKSGMQTESPVNSKLVFAYAGGVATSGIRSPVKFIEYLIKLQKYFEFHIYTSSDFKFLEPLAKVSSDRIILHKALPRDELMTELSKMNFLVNFDNGTTTQMPSKLIDYALTGLPVLNLDPQNPNINLINEFLAGNYENAFRLENVEAFRIENVCNSFLDLMNG